MIQPDSAETSGSQPDRLRSSPGISPIGPPDGGCPVAVERAKGVLMEWFGVSLEQAGQLLQAWARQCTRSTEAVAEVLVHQVWEGDDTCCDRTVARTLEQALRDLPRVVALTLDCCGEHLMTENTEEVPWYPSPEGPGEFPDPGVADDAEEEDDRLAIDPEGL